MKNYEYVMVSIPLTAISINVLSLTIPPIFGVLISVGLGSGTSLLLGSLGGGFPPPPAKLKQFFNTILHKSFRGWFLICGVKGDTNCVNCEPNTHSRQQII